MMTLKDIELSRLADAARSDFSKAWDTERGCFKDPELDRRYRAWLEEQNKTGAAV